MGNMMLRSNVIPCYTASYGCGGSSEVWSISVCQASHTNDRSPELYSPINTQLCACAESFSMWMKICVMGPALRCRVLSFPLKWNTKIMHVGTNPVALLFTRNICSSSLATVYSSPQGTAYLHEFVGDLKNPCTIGRCNGLSHNLRMVGQIHQTLERFASWECLHATLIRR